MTKTIEVQISEHDYDNLACFLEKGNVFLYGPLHVLMLANMAGHSIKGVMTTLPSRKDNKDSQ